MKFNMFRSPSLPGNYYGADPDQEGDEDLVSIMYSCVQTELRVSFSLYFYFVYTFRSEIIRFSN